MRSILAFGTILLSLGITSVAATAQEIPDTVEEVTDHLKQRLTEAFQAYDEQLQAVLKTRFPEEKAFVNEVVYLVQERKLPKNVVDSAWLWVRKNRPATNYPFVYFERILRLEARRLKLPLPKFDAQLYMRASQRFTDSGDNRR